MMPCRISPHTDRRSCSTPGHGGPRRTLAAAGALVTAAIALAGCGGSSGTSTTSSAAAGGSGSYASQTADSNKLAAFSQCMRAHGLSDFPDPVNGHLNLTVRKGSDLDPSSSQFQSALGACKSLEPAGFAGSGSPSTGQQNRVLEFVNCLHKHGETGVPDPSSSGAVLMSGGSVDPNSPTFQAAMQACRSLLPAGTVGG
jgi:hypothetical protein